MTHDDCGDVRREAMDYYGFGPEAMKRTRVCSCCGTATTSGADRCAVCGARLPEETLFDLYCRDHHRCPRCGAVLGEDDRFCPHCGREIQASQS